MNESSEHRSWFSLLNKWLSGRINSQEERQLDQLAQEDAFLAEALEGYRSFPESGHLQDLTQLKAKLRKRTGAKRRLAPVLFVRIAAAAVFAGIIGGVWYFNNAFENNSNLAFQTEQSEIATPTISENDPNKLIDTDSIHKQLTDNQEEASQNSFTLTEKDDKPSSTDSAAKTKEDPALEPADIADYAYNDSESPKPAPALENKDQTIEEEETISTLVSPPTSSDDAVNLPPTRPQIEPTIFDAPPLKKEEAFAFHKEISGKVIDPRGEPLSGASVFVPGTSTGVLTDIDGQFTIKLDQNISSLRVDYIGYESQQISLGQENNLQVRMDEDALALSEISVTANKAKRKNSMDKISAKEMAASSQPKGGFKDLEKYIQKKLKYPKKAKENNIEGIVKLQFVVLPTGSLSNFVVLESLSKECDQEAIRLLQNGPKWQATNQTPVTYSISFKLK